MLAVVLLAVLLVAMPGLAAAKGGHGGGPGGASFNILGTIDALDARAGTIEVGDITVYTTDDTHFKQCEDGVSVRITFDDLEKGWKVRIKGVVDDGTYVASVVIQYVP